MKSLYKLFFLAVVFFLNGCATSYQKMSFSGGFDETQLAENVWKVHFSGNGYTGRNRAEEMTLLRSADLTLQNGFTHFILASSSSASDYSTYTTPSTSTTTASAYGSGGYAYGTANTTTYGGQTFIVSKPSTTNTVVMYKSKPAINGVTYDAQFLCNTLGAKLSVQCGTLR